MIKLEIKPPLKWAGGKRWLIKFILAYWEIHNNKRLVEPLCGGLAITFGLCPSKALLNDINPHLINFYNWIKKGLNLTIPMQNDENLYYKHRKSFNELVSEGNICSRETAELFYYLNRTGYNGLCRFNKQGFFNVPFGKYKNINYIRDFNNYIEVFRNCDFICYDFENLNIGENDFIYADPPYDVEFTQYSKEDFGWEDQIRLAKWLSCHNGPVLLSNQATTRIIRLYRELNFNLRFFDAPRMISCNGNRTPAKEVLAMKGI